MIGAFVCSLRPRQWTKNLLVFAAVVFAFRLNDEVALWRSVIAFFIFCALSGAVYLFNDLRDVEKDRRHPVKKDRPIASGRLSAGVASIGFVTLFFGGLFLSYFLLGIPALIVSLLYLLLMAGYGLVLKNVPILDMITIAVGFVLRAIMGAVVVEVPISAWLLICTFLLSLLLAVGKRRGELVSSGETTRTVLQHYDAPYLDALMVMVGSATIISYALYTFFSKTAAQVAAYSEETARSSESFSNLLLMTIPFVVYGIFRYLLLVMRDAKGEEPEEILLRDRPTQLNIVFWILSVLIILYLERF